jgi:hypothetical protein
MDRALEHQLAEVTAAASFYSALFLTFVFVAVGYIAIVIDRARAGSPGRDDTQAGLKLVVFGLAMAALSLVVLGVVRLLSTILGGFHDFVHSVRINVPAMIVGAGVLAGLATLVLPRTNHASHRQVERFATGLLTLQYGIAAIVMVYFLLTDVFLAGSWAEISDEAAHTVIYVVVAGAALLRFGSASGWSAPTPRPLPPPPLPEPQQAVPQPTASSGTAPLYAPPPEGGNPYAPR